MNWKKDDLTFLKWLKENKIIYNEKNTDLMNALYCEYKIEKQTKTNKTKGGINGTSLKCR